MRLAIVVGILLGLARPSHANDSTWLVCKGIASPGATKMHLVVSAIEQRAANGSDRDLSLTIMRGDHVSRAVATKIETGKPRAFTARRGKHVTIDGRVTLASDMSTLALDGTIDPSFGIDAKQARASFTAKLACETLDDLAIGH